MSFTPLEQIQLMIRLILGGNMLIFGFKYAISILIIKLKHKKLAPGDDGTVAKNMSEIDGAKKENGILCYGLVR